MRTVIMSKALDQIIDRRTEELADLISLRTQMDITIAEKIVELKHFVKKRDEDNQEDYGR